MPLQHDDDIQASAPLRRLRSGQWRSMAPLLRRETGRRALRIGVADDDAVPPLPDMAWTRLWLARDGYRGDLRSHADDPLPFIDEAFDLVWLQHALEPAPQTAALLAEACRVLAPGGILLVTAVHPLGGWAPWFRWHARGQRQSLQWPWRLRQYLQRDGLEVESLRRLGAYRPGTQAVGDDSRWGGAYLMLARKQRRIATPLKLRPLPAHAPVNARLSPGTRRHSVS
ncbi:MULTISPECIES: class I SAM-dependent methyltransferase [Rhodanobacter]|uniref:Class I SAM-dependent methyltransferase n=1 Tax=Rhodanobacter hydrolyticus TaxID=2250595 RepID=A0ABW8J3D9_9GAMM|nr:class I SAM-dependent methyltransferase [Rhodanobacter sp. 7MK24]MBD8880951.1 class I SAM-dependent methyltransferase [Rhodanobacter sp. 7MK24]